MPSHTDFGRTLASHGPKKVFVAEDNLKRRELNVLAEWCSETKTFEMDDVDISLVDLVNAIVREEDDPVSAAIDNDGKDKHCFTIQAKSQMVGENYVFVTSQAYETEYLTIIANNAKLHITFKKLPDLFVYGELITIGKDQYVATQPFDWEGRLLEYASLTNKKIQKVSFNSLMEYLLNDGYLVKLNGITNNLRVDDKALSLRHI